MQTKTQYLDMLVRRSDPRFIQNVKPQIDTLYENLVLVHPTDSAALTAAGLYWYSTERVDKAKELLRKNMTLYPESLGATVPSAILTIKVSSITPTSRGLPSDSRPTTRPRTGSRWERI